jgi:hypothetical protein
MKGTWTDFTKTRHSHQHIPFRQFKISNYLLRAQAFAFPCIMALGHENHCVMSKMKLSSKVCVYHAWNII